jgi:hypothetical protein
MAVEELLREALAIIVPIGLLPIILPHRRAPKKNSVRYPCIHS